MSKQSKYFSSQIINKEEFSPSIHWEHCLLLEREMLDFLKYVPIYGDQQENWKINSPKLIDIFVKTCFLFEAAMKGITNDPTGRVAEFLNGSSSASARFFLQKKNREGKDQELNILDFLTFYQEYCSLKFLEVRVKYSQHISDIWINRMLCIRPFLEMEVQDNLVTKSPDWWKIYADIKHHFYSNYKNVNLEISFGALAALISFSAVVPDMRRLLCDHGYIQDDFRKPVDIDNFGRRKDGKFIKDPFVRHTELVLDGCEAEESMGPIACVSDLFIVPINGDYKKKKLWSGLARNKPYQ